MVQEINIPLSALNFLLPRQPLEDVTFRIPQLSDIDETVDDLLPTPDDLRTFAEEGFIRALEDATAVDELIDAIVDPLVAEIEAQTGIDFPDVDEIAAAVADAIDTQVIGPIEVDIEGSLFDIQQDLLPLLQELLEQINFGDVSGFPSLGDLQQLLTDVLTEFFPDILRSADDLAEWLQGELTAFLEGLPGGALLLDPFGFVTDVFDRLLSEALTDEEIQAIRDELEDEP